MHQTSYVLRESKINLNSFVESTFPSALHKINSQSHLKQHIYRITTEAKEGDEQQFKRWKDKEEIRVGKRRKTPLKKMMTAGNQNTYIICIDKKTNKKAIVFDLAAANSTALANSMEFSAANLSNKVEPTTIPPIVKPINKPHATNNLSSQNDMHAVSNTNSKMNKQAYQTGYAKRFQRIKSTEKGMKNLFTSYNRFQMDQRRERFSESVRKIKGLMAKGFIQGKSNKFF